MVRLFDVDEWLRRKVEGSIAEYMRGIKEKTTLNWALGEVKFAKKWGLSDDDLIRIISRMESDPVYHPIRTLEGIDRLAKLKARCAPFLATEVEE